MSDKKTGDGKYKETPEKEGRHLKLNVLYLQNVLFFHKLKGSFVFSWIAVSIRDCFCKHQLVCLRFEFQINNYSVE
jgi:hypothetical protein